MFAFQFTFAQESIEEARISNLKSFCSYIKDTDTLKLDTSILFSRYIDINYIRSDTSAARIKSRIGLMLKLCNASKATISAIDLENYQVVKLAYFHFKKPSEYEELLKAKEQVYVYYLKSNPEIPAGFLLFAPNSDKLYSWILINQGGYHYFLTLNLI
jgi:hypothetical protein